MPARFKAGQIRSRCVRDGAILGNDDDAVAYVIKRVTISPPQPENHDDPLYYVRDGIVIFPKNGTIPHGTVI